MPHALVVLWPLFGGKKRRREVGVLLTPPGGTESVTLGRGMYTCTVVPEPRVTRQLGIDLMIRNNGGAFSWSGRADLSDELTWTAGEIRLPAAGEYRLSWSFDREPLGGSMISGFPLFLEPVIECTACGRVTRAGKARCPECKSLLPPEPPSND